MRLNKSTFFLVCLGALFALGTALITTPVAAHDASQLINNVAPPAHSHPTAGLDVAGNNNYTDAGDIPPHNVHPVVESITLDPIPATGTGDNVTPARTLGNHVIITADDDGNKATPATGLGNNQFILIVEFKDDIDTNLDPFDADELGNALLNALGATVTGEIDIGAPAAVVTGTGANAVTSKKKFKVKVTVDAESDSTVTDDTDEAIPNGTADDALEKLTLRIRLDGSAVLSEQTLVIDPGQVAPVTAAGSANVASKVYEFVFVKTLPETDAPTLAITHDPADGTAVGDGDMVTFTFTFTDASGIATEGDGAFTADDVDVTGGRKGKGDFAVISNLVYTLKVTPTTMYTDVTVSVAAGSVTDAAGVPNDVAATSATYTAPVPDPDGVITIPGGEFVVVVKDKTAVGSQFSSDVMTAEWIGMPNLQRLFDRSQSGNGGALILKAHTPATITAGTVGISEIMWATDDAYRGTTQETASQWIELHNLNATAVKVSFEDLTGAAVTVAKLNAGIDYIANLFDETPGESGWDLIGHRGQSGNSVAGTDFVSMMRIRPNDDGLKPFSNADKRRYSNRKGSRDDSWKSSTVVYLKARTAANAEYNYKGTPGDVNDFNRYEPPTKDKQTEVKSNNIIINEVANRDNANAKYEWIELKHVGGERNLRRYRISMVTAVDQDKLLIDFPNDNNATIPANGYLLLVASDPANDPDHPLAVGYNVDKKAAEQRPGVVQADGTINTPVRYKVINFQNGGLPNDGKFVLILRSPDNAGKNDAAELGKDDLDKIKDIAGWNPDLVAEKYSNDVSRTDLWPLKNFKPANIGANKLEMNRVHQRNQVTTKDGRSGVGTNNGDGNAAFGDRGYTGIGYRRNELIKTHVHGGTPGYENGSLKSQANDATDVYISEIMYESSGDNHTLAQWIELRNRSKTIGVDLGAWELTITNHSDIDDAKNDWTGKGTVTIPLSGMKIKPNSAILIVSRKGPRAQVYLPDSDIFVIYPALRTNFGMSNPGDDILNPYGFKIEIKAKQGNDWKTVDTASNLSKDKDERGSLERFNKPAWTWPNGTNEDGDRVSVARVSSKDMLKGVVDGTLAIKDGPDKGGPVGWKLSNDDNRTDLIDATYYGHKNDISTPGQTLGQPLPVELSSFRPTLEDGKVVVRWTTESELDNAGFNIYRSETRNGEFKQVNAQLIQGAGTTGERNTYEWVDTTAKPDVVYYYQIEDVSFAGERQRLATNRLRGMVSAKNKLTTRWGELKSQE